MDYDNAAQHTHSHSHTLTHTHTRTHTHTHTHTLGAGPPLFVYGKAAQPAWAFDNQALHSIPGYEDPEGPANRALLLGS